MLMVLRQPDLGTALTYLPIAIMGLFLGGLHWKQAAIVILAGGLMMPLAWHVLKPYQRERLVSFMEPEADSQGSGYQVIQSLIAVGSGGIWVVRRGRKRTLLFFQCHKPTSFSRHCRKSMDLSARWEYCCYTSSC